MAKPNLIYSSIISFLLLCLLTGIYFISKSNTTPNLLENHGEEAFNLSAHWSQGNIVALIRHTERCDRSENQCLEGNTGITEVGKKEAIQLGKDFKALLTLNNAILYHSPLKRTVQTTHFLFGNASIEKKWLRKGCKKNLFEDIFRHKEEGKDLVLVTHGTCIQVLGEAQGNKLIHMDIYSDKTYGTTIFIALDKSSKQAYVLGYFFPKDWVKLLENS